MAWGLALTGALGLAGAYALAVAAMAVFQRTAEPNHSMANGAFALGWAGLAVMMLTDGLRVLLGLGGAPDHALYLMLIELKILATAFAIGGFGTYVLYLWSGRRWVWAPVTAFGVIHAAFFLILTLNRLPIEVVVGDWATRLHVAPGGFVPGGQLTGIALYFLPLLALTVLYLGLWRRVATRTQHWRLLLVSGCLLLFLGAGSVQANPSVSPDGPVVPVALGVMMVAAWVAKWTFTPPAWFSRVFRIVGLRREGHPHLH